MARQNPLGKVKDLTVETLKLPTKVAGKAVGQAKGAAAAGLHVADHVTRSAVTTVGSLVQQRRGGASAEAPEKIEKPTAKVADPVTVDVDPEEPVNVVEELGLDAAPVEAPKKPKKKAAKKTPGRSSAAVTTIDAAADSTEVAATPADVAKKVAKKSPARKSAAKKAPAKKAPAKKAATSSPSGKLPPRKKPLSAAELAQGAGPEAITSVGTRGAGVGTNPSTGEANLQQPGTEPLMDPATTKAVKAEQATLSSAADTNKS